MEIRIENLQSLLMSTMTDRSCHFCPIILTIENFHCRRIPKNFLYTTKQKSFPFWEYRRIIISKIKYKISMYHNLIIEKKKITI